MCSETDFTQEEVNFFLNANYLNFELFFRLCKYTQGVFLNWPSPENVSRLAPPKNASTGPP